MVAHRQIQGVGGLGKKKGVYNTGNHWAMTESVPFFWESLDTPLLHILALISFLECAPEKN